MTAWLKASIRAHPGCWGSVLNAAFCTVVGAVLSLAMSGSLAPAYFAASYSIGFSIHACIAVVHLYGPRWLPRWVGETVAAMCGIGPSVSVSAVSSWTATPCSCWAATRRC